MATALADILTTLDQWAPFVAAGFAGCALALGIRWFVSVLRRRREAVLRDLELGIPIRRRRWPLWAHALVGAVVGGILGAVVLLPWLLLAATQQGAPATAVVPGLVGDSILIALVTAPVFPAVVAARRRWAARTAAAREAGIAFQIRWTAHRYQLQEEE